jgi:hypothetical protein
MQAYYRSIDFQGVEAPIFLDIRYMKVVDVVSPVHRQPLEIIPETQHRKLLCDSCVTYDINYNAIIKKKAVIIRHKATYSSCLLLLSEIFTSSLCVRVARQSQGRNKYVTARNRTH